MLVLFNYNCVGAQRCIAMVVIVMMGHVSARASRVSSTPAQILDDMSVLEVGDDDCTYNYCKVVEPCWSWFTCAHGVCFSMVQPTRVPPI